MANPYFTHTNQFLPGSVARGDVVDARFTALITSFDGVNTDIKRAIKVPTSITDDQVLPALSADRANRFVGYDVTGDVLIMGTPTSITAPILAASDANKIMQANSTGTAFEMSDSPNFAGTLSVIGEITAFGGVNSVVANSDLSHGWFVGSALYGGLTKSLVQDATPSGVFFKPDGTKMYMVGSASDTVYQYTLSTPWLVTSIVYDTVSLDISGQDLGPQGVFFSSDGTKMYVVGIVGDAVYQYTLSTAWDLSTATYDSVLLDVSSEDSVPTGMFFKPDGTKIYVVGQFGVKIHQYTLSEAWDIGTATYDSINFSVSPQTTTPQSMAMSLDGVKLYVLGDSLDSVHQYTLATPWDVSTAVYDSVSFSTNAQDSTATSIFFKPDGKILYMVGSASAQIYQYSLPVFELSNITGRVGIHTDAAAGILHVDQYSTVGNIPVLYLDQADVSEEFIRFVATEAVGNSVEAVGAKTLTTTKFIRVNINGTDLYFQAGTIA